MHEARVHDAIPARDREATGDSFTNRAITLIVGGIIDDIDIGETRRS